jgi:glycosyltransferase involved in cell wall biosynthesis
MPPPRPIRVMRIITRLNVGGPAYQAIFLTQRLQSPEFDSRLLTGSVGPEEGSMEPLAEERGVRFTRVPGLGREISPSTDGLTLFRLYREMRRLRPDIVHTHLAKAGAVGRLAARLARVPAVVHTYHGHVLRGYFSPRKSELFARVERTLARWTDRIVVLGEAQKQEILGFGIGRPEQMVRIPLGLELEPFLKAESCRGRLREELGICPSAPVVGIVARLVPIKAHDLFLRAAARVSRARPEAQFLIVGDGELRRELERQAASLGFRVHSSDQSPKSKVQSPKSQVSPIPNPQSPNRNSLSTQQPAIRFLGFRPDLPTIYSDLDVVVLCSLNEGLPVTIIEALAAARPVVSTEVGAVRDLVTPGETGLLVPSGDEASLSQAILDLLADPETAERMGRKGRKVVFPNLSVERLERDIRRLYEELREGCGG